MVALHFTKSLLLVTISILAASAHPAIPAALDISNEPVDPGAGRSADAAWSLTIYSEPNGPSDAITLKSTGSSPTNCKNSGGSSFSFDNLCDPMAQVGFSFEAFADGDCWGDQQKFSSTTEPVNKRFYSWRTVEVDEC